MDKKLEMISELKEKGEFKKAYKQIKELYEVNHESSEIKEKLIEILFAYGFYLSEDLVMQYEKAAKCFREIIDLDPDNYRAYYNLGICYFDMDKAETALNMYQKALELKSDNKYVHYNIGLAYEEMRQYKKALKAYDRALKIDQKFIYAQQAKRILNMSLEHAPEETITFEEKEKLNRLKSLIRVSSKVKIDDIQEILDAERGTLLDLIVDWAEEYGFTIEGDFLVFNEKNKTSFLENLRTLKID